jgi:hypothetical protein
MRISDYWLKNNNSFNKWAQKFESLEGVNSTNGLKFGSCEKAYHQNMAGSKDAQVNAMTRLASQRMV